MGSGTWREYSKDGIYDSGDAGEADVGVYDGKGSDVVTL